MTSFTGDGCPQNLHRLTNHLLALVARLSGRSFLALFDKTQLFCQIYRSQLAQQFASAFGDLSLIKHKATQARDADPVAANREFVIGEIKRLVGLALFLVAGIIGSACEEVVIGFREIIKGSFHHTFRDLVGPWIGLFTDLIELFFERKGTGRREGALLFRNGFLLLFVRLILLLPLFAPPVVDKSSGATGSFKVVNLFMRWVEPYLLPGFHWQAPF